MQLIPNFNSIKVRLELVVMLSASIINEFQFHKGAIRTILRVSIPMLSSSFQFHKGAIRTLAASRSQLLGTVFQFHKGAIRTVLIMTNL